MKKILATVAVFGCFVGCKTSTVPVGSGSQPVPQVNYVGPEDLRYTASFTLTQDGVTAEFTNVLSRYASYVVNSEFCADLGEGWSVPTIERLERFAPALAQVVSTNPSYCGTDRPCAASRFSLWGSFTSDYPTGISPAYWIFEDARQNADQEDLLAAVCIRNVVGEVETSALPNITIEELRALCGDGVQQPGEACDFGPFSFEDGSSCRNNCRELIPTAVNTLCGNGVRESTEFCDWGENNSLSAGHCSLTCSPVGWAGPGGQGHVNRLDVNNDGIITILDRIYLTTLLAGFEGSSVVTRFQEAYPDVNGDSFLSTLDLHTFDQNYFVGLLQIEGGTGERKDTERSLSGNNSDTPPPPVVSVP